MKWYKIPRGMPSDPKLAVIAKRSGLSRAEVVALYISLLDAAAAGEPAGALDTFDAEEAATLLELEPARVDAALRAFRAKKLISDNNKITCWAGRPSSSTLRVRAFRKRQRDMPPQAPPAKPPALHPDHPAAVAARRERLMQNEPPQPKSHRRPLP